jgi:hypothetical protein
MDTVAQLQALAKSCDHAVDRAMNEHARIVLSLTWERAAGDDRLVPTLRVDIAPRIGQ